MAVDSENDVITIMIDVEIFTHFDISIINQYQKYLLVGM